MKRYLPRFVCSCLYRRWRARILIWFPLLSCIDRRWRGTVDKDLRHAERRVERGYPLILVPDVEKCPVITVENDRPFTPEIADVMLKNAFERNGMTWFRYDMNSQPFDVSWGTLGMGMTTDYESAKEFGMNTGEWLGENGRITTQSRTITAIRGNWI